MSHSIHMLSIQIDTKSFQYQFNNIKLSFIASEFSMICWKGLQVTYIVYDGVDF